MPLHLIYHPPGLYSASEKQALVDDITGIYTAASLPAFWVVVIFRPVAASDFFVGGRGPQSNFVRIVVQHIARNYKPDEVAKMRGFMQKYNDVIEPYTKGKGMHWEVNVDNLPSELWVVDGLRPPFGATEEEERLRRVWAEKNEVVLEGYSVPPIEQTEQSKI
ncbi:putative oxalocrotonate tautomerase [Sphaerosporella brunnea]|uniref:Putative oxalocrotonate tautomerase n=1 Tax=Sphaerosporella brunnea TaxID=1250544 RepID=A0A5J5EET7_9PEZI|nr:putative oxalocrotonate tautomerase [Sphaerosporella brunnea]KAA8894183.1 putative oxalocrotonate tautomerase [Sphaerosporella brunnea]